MSKMKDSSVNWQNASYMRDVAYCRIEDAPILAKLIQLYGLFWDGAFCYRIEGKYYIKRFPEWRNKVRIDLEKVKKKDPFQKQLKSFAMQ